MAADIASCSVTVLPERIVTVKSGMDSPFLGPQQAVCAWEVLIVIAHAGGAADQPQLHVGTV
jgi:hypothetical protein